VERLDVTPKLVASSHVVLILFVFVKFSAKNQNLVADLSKQKAELNFFILKSEHADFLNTQMQQINQIKTQAFNHRKDSKFLVK
jgi:hypothetical protein